MSNNSKCVACRTCVGAMSGNMTSDIPLPLAPSAYIGIGVFILITGMFGTITNCMSLVMFVREKVLRTPIDYLIINLCLTDLGMTAVCFPFIVSSNFAQKWLFTDVGCSIYGFLGFLFGNCTITTLSAISIERYFLVCKNVPVTMLSRRGYVMKSLSCIWVYTLMWSFLPLVFDIGYQLEPFGTSCTVRWSGGGLKNKIFIVCLVVLVVLSNVLVMIFCYINIIYISVHRRMQGRRKHFDISLSLFCLLIMCVFLLLWTPYCIVSLLSTFGWEDHLNVWLTVLPVMFAKLSACVNPVLYILFNHRYRQTFLQTFRCVKANPTRTQSSESTWRTTAINDLSLKATEDIETVGTGEASYV